MSKKIITYKDLVNGIRKGLFAYPGEKTPEFINFGLASELLRFYLGNDWVNENLFEMHKSVSKRNRTGRQFFKTDKTEEVEKHRHQFKLIRLAEHFFNLQEVEGFIKVVDEIKSGKIDSIFAEIESGGQLYRNNIQFKFIEPSGAKGSDYDIEIINTENGNENICCEVKNKIEGTTPSKNSILNPLNNSKSQLPKNSPGLIFIKIPEEWIKNPELKKIIEEAIEEFFRNTERIIAVIFRWEILYGPLQNGMTMFPSMFKIYRNKRCKFQKNYSDGILDTLESVGNSNWKNFNKISLKHGVYLIDRLSDNMKVIDGLVGNIPPELAKWKPSEEKLSINEIINLLCDVETEDFKKNLIIVLENEKMSLYPLNPLNWPKQRKYNDRDTTQSLKNFLEERRKSIDWFEDLNFPNWDSIALISSNNLVTEITAGRILELWVGNELLMISEIINRLIGFYERK